MASRFLNNITINDQYTLPSADGTADQIITTDGAGQLSFVDQSTLNSGSAERTEILVKNVHGSALSKGDPVYIVGSVGASDRLEVALADAGNANKMPCVGLLTQDLAINGEGTATVTGKLRNLITSPIDGATPTENDTIYVKSGGGLTLTKPTGSTNLIQNVGQVGRVSASSDGNIVVSAILRSNDVPNLLTGKIWVGSTGNTVESTVVHLDETNERMGIGTASPSELLHIEGNFPEVLIKGTGVYDPSVITMSNGSGDSSFITNYNNPGVKGLWLRYDNGSTGDATIKVGQNELLFDVNNGTAMYINSSRNVGINATSLYSKLHIGNSSNSNNNLLTMESSGPVWVHLKTPSNTQSQIGFGESQFVNQNTRGRIVYNSSTTAANNYMSFVTNFAEVMRITNSNVGIGTTSPAEKLAVSGNASITNNLYVGVGNTLKSCTYPAQYSLVVGTTNTLGGISSGIIGRSNSIDCTTEPWLGLGGNFIAGISNNIFGGYSHANAVIGQLNELGTSSINNANTIIGGSEHEATSNNALLFGQRCRALGAHYSLTGGFDSNNFGGFGSIAIGAGATASTGNNQYAFGTGVTTPTSVSAAYGPDQFVVGKFNEYTNSSSVPHRFAVGNGANDASRDTPFCIIGSGTYTSGQVSINDSDGFAYTSAPYSILHVNGRATSSYSSTFTITSDERVKKNIVDYSKGLAEIIQVQPKSYAFNGKGNTIEDVESIGVLAQEIKNVFPETVGTVNKKLNPEDEQETELYTVDISPVTYALINAVKELNAKVEALEAKIQTLEGN